jgi:hypothetical protein
MRITKCRVCYSRVRNLFQSKLYKIKDWLANVTALVLIQLVSNESAFRLALEKYTEVAKTKSVRTDPRFRSAFPSIVV